MYAYEHIQHTLEYIEQHLHENIETEKLAEIASLSPFYYQRLFKRLVRKSVQEYFKLRRFAVVLTELGNKENRILDIALKYGYCDHANFTRAFKEIYHITPEEYRKNLPMLNTFDKPELASCYMMMEEHVPLVVGTMVLEIQRKSLKTSEHYAGFVKEVCVSEQIPVGESTGIDVPGQLWREFHKQRMQTEDSLFHHGIELGVSYNANLENGTFQYFAGGMVSSLDVCPAHMVSYTLPAEEYIVCHIEAETREELVTTALNQATKYLFETWLPNQKLITKPFMAEKYDTSNTEIHSMEIWVIPMDKETT